MLGDVLLIGEHHRRAAAALVAAVLGRLPVDGRLVVAISGESGSGKSELSHLLAKGLTAAGLPAKTIAGDNFFRIDPLERSAWRVERGVEARVGLGEVDWDAFDRCVADFRAGNKLRPWFYTIAANVRRMHFRRAGRKPEAEWNPDSHGEPSVGPLSSTPEQRTLRRALDQLRANQRDVLVLHYYEELSFSEVAEVLGISTSAAKGRAHRAYKLLRALLDE